MKALVQFFTPGESFPRVAVVEVDPSTDIIHSAINEALMMHCDYNFGLTDTYVQVGDGLARGQYIVDDVFGDTAYITIISN